jgi:hypothetical protein
LARPTKQGLDYFPVDVNFDDKIELFIAEEGAEGIGILVTIWQLIYQNEGYFIKNNEALVMLIRRRTMSDIEIIRRIIQSLLARNVFSKTKENKYKILTSKGIQKRFFEITSRRKKFDICHNYLCLGLNVAITPENTTLSTQSKVKESKVKESKVKESKVLLSLLQNLWNERIKLSKSGLRNVIQNSKDRKSKERLRLKSRDEESWTTVFDKINNSTFCCGENDQQWKASYDWIMANETNAIKVLEGKYDGATTSTKKEHVNTAELVKKRAAELETEKKAKNDN